MQVSTDQATALDDFLKESVGAGHAMSDGERRFWAFQNRDVLPQFIPRMAALLNTIASPLGPHGVIIDGLPHSKGLDDLEVSKNISLLTGWSLGPEAEPFAYHQEKGGDLISVLTPQPGMESSESGEGRAAFGHHGDFVYGEGGYGQPESIILAGVANDPRARTTITSVEDVKSDLTSVEIEALRQPKFITKVSPETGVGERDTVAKPILWKTRADEDAISIRSSTRAVDSADQPLVDRLHRLLVKHEVAFELQPGTLAVFRNDLTTHSRKAIEGAGTRIVLRTYVGRLAALRQAAWKFDATQIL